MSMLRTRTAGCIVCVSDIDPLFYISQRVAEKDHPHCMMVVDTDKHDQALQDYQRWCTDLAQWATTLQEVHKIRETVNASRRMRNSFAPGEIRKDIRTERKMTRRSASKRKRGGICRSAPHSLNTET
jgi:hypothetical protein